MSSVVVCVVALGYRGMETHQLLKTVDDRHTVQALFDTLVSKLMYIVYNVRGCFKAPPTNVSHSLSHHVVAIEKLNIKVVDPGVHTGLPTASQYSEIEKAQKDNLHFLGIPRRLVLFPEDVPRGVPLYRPVSF